MLCKDLMTKSIISASSQTTIFQISCLMTENNIGFIPIIENNNLIGVITDRDIIKRVIACSVSINSSVNNYMTKSIIYTFDTDDISLAITKMADYQIKRIIILNQVLKVVGLITLKDLALNNNTNKYINDLLKEISLNYTNPVKYLEIENVEV